MEIQAIRSALRKFSITTRCPSLLQESTPWRGSDDQPQGWTPLPMGTGLLRSCPFVTLLDRLPKIISRRGGLGRGNDQGARRPFISRGGSTRPMIVGLRHTPSAQVTIVQATMVAAASVCATFSPTRIERMQAWRHPRNFIRDWPL